MLIRIEKRGTWYDLYFGNSMTWDALFAIEIGLASGFMKKKCVPLNMATSVAKKGMCFRLVLLGFVFVAYIMPFFQKNKTIE